MIKNKIKSLLSLKGLTFADYSRKLGITPQSLQTKSKKEAYKIKDLIELSQLTNTKLAFIDENNNPIIVFDEEDIKRDDL